LPKAPPLGTIISHPHYATPYHTISHGIPTPDPSIHHHNNVAVIVVGQPMRSVYRLLRLLPLCWFHPHPHPHPDPYTLLLADPAQSEFQAHSYVASDIGNPATAAAVFSSFYLSPNIFTARNQIPTRQRKKGYTYRKYA